MNKKVKIKYHCGAMVSRVFFCRGSGVAKVSLVDLVAGAAKIDCPICKATLRQGNGHFQLYVER